ncbi:MAG: VIT1/CCC1 transporter family protein [Oligoflexia bacterium]|nr:VIT1/CCC1 transporter family protein [Oligoflexia bacterium]
MAKSPHHHHHHVETHFKSPEILRDLVLGMSDGLTVPFALAAGLYGATSSNSLIVTAGIAEIVAGSIAMGLGGYLAAKSEVEHYSSERAREQREVRDIPHVEEKEIYEVFEAYGLDEKTVRPVAEALSKNPEAWVDFMMRFELGLEKPDPRRAFKGGLTIAFAYIAGGSIPLAPYIIFSDVHKSLLYSCGFTLIALLVFGYVKSKFLGTAPLKGALQTLFVGSVAASAAFFIARAIS